MFRRRTSGAPAVLDADQAPQPPGPQPPGPQSRQAGKGRPTPKRSEAERRRRQPYAAPPATKGDRKAAASRDRGQRRAEQRRRMEAMNRGEEWAMPVRERGPMRALARDYLDSRRVVLSEYVFFLVLALLIVLLVSHAAANTTLVFYVEMGVVALILAESSYHGARFGRIARQRLPGQSTRGITWYLTKRSIRLRSTRIPRPRVGRGAAF